GSGATTIAGTGAGAGAIVGNNVQVWILNPNGVAISAGATINAPGFLAAALTPSTTAAAWTGGVAGNATGTLDLSSAGAAGDASNAGTITAAGGANSYVVLAGEHASNAGTITAQFGTVELASGRVATVSFNGGLIQYQLDTTLANGSAIAATDAVTNSGSITTGNAILAANVGSTTTGLAVNNSGGIRAVTAVAGPGGTIQLLGYGASAGITASTSGGAAPTIDATGSVGGTVLMQGAGAVRVAQAVTTGAGTGSVGLEGTTVTLDATGALSGSVTAGTGIYRATTGGVAVTGGATDAVTNLGVDYQTGTFAAPTGLASLAIKAGAGAVTYSTATDLSIANLSAIAVTNGGSVAGVNGITTSGFRSRPLAPMR
ncbi:MAG: hypothetical protein NTZ79_17840, partial [Proteobacteria bacterium]|nr:hypothetical protein [Pseudomonadota bacterium]